MAPAQQSAAGGARGEAPRPEGDPARTDFLRGGRGSTTPPIFLVLFSQLSAPTRLHWLLLEARQRPSSLVTSRVVVVRRPSQRRSVVVSRWCRVAVCVGFMVGLVVLR